MDKCHDAFGTPENCSELTILTDEDINKCSQPPLVNEKTEGECKWHVFEYLYCGDEMFG